MNFLNSGALGSGKSLNAVQKGIEWVKEGRKVYYLNIEVDEGRTGFHKFPGTIEEWEEKLVPGDCLILDEAQDFLPKGLTFRNVPSWVSRFSRVRQLGLDILFITQEPKNMDSFVRRLINTHEHFVNVFGQPRAKVYKWPVGVEDPTSRAQQDRAESYMWNYPTDLYGAYKSAVLHTRKAYTPRPIKMFRWALAGCAAAVIVALVAVRAFSHSGSPEAPTKKGSEKTAEAAAGFFDAGRGGKVKPLTDAEYAAQFKPRLAGIPWSEPLFDSRKAESQPELYCISSEERCLCMSEQGTHVDIKDKVCRDIVKNGLYNPFRRPSQQSQVAQRTDQTQDQALRGVPTYASDRFNAPQLGSGGGGASSAALQAPSGTGRIGYGPSVESR